MKHSIFAMELCFAIQPGGTLRAQLHALVARHPQISGLSQKWSMYRTASGLLHSHLATAVAGCWDFFDDDARALKDYDMWCTGMITREGARTSPSGVGDPYRGDARYMTFTMAFLVAQGAQSERALATRCAIPPGQLWERATFARLLDGLAVLNFASVKSDVAYVIPGDDAWCLTAEDLRAPKFHYLRPLT